MRIRLLSLVLALLVPLPLLPTAAHARPAQPAQPGEPAQAVQAVPGRVLVGLASGAAVDGAGLAGPAAGGPAEPAETPARAQALLADLAGRVGASKHHLLGLDDVVSLTVEPEQVDQAMAALEADPRVAWAAPDVLLHADVVPTDPYWPQQWGAQRIGLPAAWDRTTGAGDVVIAVLDTGLDAGHPDFAGRVLPGYDVVGGDADPADDHGHGTSAAAVAAAALNGVGIAGACGRCSLLPVKVLGADGSGPVSGVAMGINWAIAHGADVINLSLGTPSPHPLLDQAVAAARAAGVVVVASAGNKGTNLPSYPAALPGVLGVVGTDPGDARYSWSQWGTWADLTAPGCNPSLALGGSYVMFCGTSSAAPLVTGVVALGLATGAAPAAVVQALTSGAVPLGGLVAHGRVDAAAMMAALPSAPGGGGASRPPLPPDPGTPTRELSRLAGGSRYDTAAAVAREAFPHGAQTVYVATGRTFPDALAAGPAAATAGGPVLLTDPAMLPDAVRDALRQLTPVEIVVAGGSNGVSDRVLGALADIAPVRRLAGADRYATAAAIARDSFDGPVPVVYLASGASFADALSGGPAAAARGGPLLLVHPDGVPHATAEALAALRPAEVVLLGGSAAVGEQVAQQVEALTGKPARRLAGANRAATAAAVAVDSHPAGAEVVYLATGRDFPDALAGGAAAGHVVAPLLLADPAGLPPATAAALRRLQPQRLVVLGGQGALPDEVIDAALSAMADPAGA